MCSLFSLVSQEAISKGSVKKGNSEKTATVSGKIPMKMAKSAPLASQGKVMDGKSNVGIEVRRGKLVLVAGGKVRVGL